MAEVTKTITAIKSMTGRALVDLIKQNDVVVKYAGDKVARLTKYSEAPTPPPENPQTPPSTSQVPADILDLKNWTLMLPTGSQGDPDNDYPERKVIPTVFYVKDGGVAFRTRADGFHSANSQYPRTELREMIDDDWTKAAWTNKTGIHTLELTEAITSIPPVKPHVVSAQLHDGSDDILQIRLEGKHLMVMYADGQKYVTLDTDYVLGTRFDIKIVAANNRVKVFYNATEKADLQISGSGWFAKAGCYLQSNVSKGDKPDAFGEVVIYKLKVTHA